MSAAVAPANRWTNAHRCPICGGADKDGRGEGQRCFGFLSDDGLYAHCSREEHAGSLPIHDGSSTYAHRIIGECKCGQQHGGTTTLNGNGKAPIPITSYVIEKIYDYCDDTGALAHQTVRYEGKSFSQRRPGTEEEFAKWGHLTWDQRQVMKAPKVTKEAGVIWTWSLHDITPVLYHLPALLAEPQRTIFLVEGEKDADTLTGLGLLSTCNPMGAGKWQEHYTKLLAQRHVVLLPDKDKAGHLHAEKVKAALDGHAKSFLVLECPNVGEHAVKDVTDWVEAGGTREQLEAMVKAARANADKIFPDEMGADELALIEFPPPIAYIPGMLFEGATLYAAPPKSGKSVSALGMAVALATGGRAFGQIKVERRRVLYFSLEDHPELIQNRLFTMIGSKRLPPLLRVMHSCRGLVELQTDLERYVNRYPDTGMVVVDTLAHARGLGARSRKDITQEDYNELIGFSHLANRLHIAIVVITHTAKALYEDELAQVSGSFGFSGAVDAIMLLQRKRYAAEAAMAVFSRRLGSEKKFELHWDELTMSYILDGEMSPQQAARTTSVIIIECLQAAATPLSIKAVAERCQIGPDVAKQRLYQLAKAGEIVSDEGRYSLARKARNCRNFVTAPEEKAVTHGYDPPDNPDLLVPPFGYANGYAAPERNRSHQSNGYEVTTVTGVFNGDVPLPYDGYGPDGDEVF
jgi:5S rRNA maturation endonuclease (ribonuclease M5)